MSLKKQINILWTGGLDSTCRIVELSRHSYIVQPYYLIDPQRCSNSYEMAAMDEIRKIIMADRNTKCDLLPTIFVNIKDIPQQEEITRSWKDLHEKYGLGIQYDWLARYARQQHLVLEISLEKSIYSKAVHTINNECQLLLDETHILSEYYVDEENSSSAGKLIFGNFLFPSSLWNMTKNDEIKEMTNFGLYEVVEKTWFCHHPVFGLPCGHCHPCQDVRKVGMSWRLSYIGYTLGSIRHFFYRTKRIVGWVFSTNR